MTDDPKTGFELEPVEGALEHIDRVFELFGDGIELDKRTTLTCTGPLNIQCVVHNDALVVTLEEPCPKVRYSFLSGYLTGAKITRDEIQVELSGLPDVSIEVKS